MSQLQIIIDAAKITAFERMQKMFKEMPESITGDEAQNVVKEVRAILERANSIIERMKGEG